MLMHPDHATSNTPHFGWVLAGTRTRASSRLQGFLVHEGLLQMGWRSTLIASDFSRCEGIRSRQFIRALLALFEARCTHVIVEGPEWPAAQLAMTARAGGLGAVAVRCDHYPGDYDALYDLTILPTQTLREQLKIERAVVIPDMVEVPPQACKQPRTGNGPLQVVWVGHQGYGDFIEGFIAELRAHPLVGDNFNFTTISSGSRFSKRWSESTVVNDILDADIAIIPVPEGQWFNGKSANRLTMMQALGMPTVAAPLDAYRAVARDGHDVLFATSVDDFARQLARLRAPDERARIGGQARHSLDPALWPQAVAQRWLQALQSVPGQYRVPAPSARRARLLAWSARVAATVSRCFVAESGRQRQ